MKYQRHELIKRTYDSAPVADETLFGDVAETDMTSLCAVPAAQDTGSATRALDIMYNVGDLARRGNDSTIMESRVHDARDEIE